MFNGWIWLGGAAAITLVISFFTQVRGLFKQLTSRVVVVVTVSGYQADAVLLYIRQHFQASRFGPRAYVGWKLFYRPERRVQLLPMEVQSPSGRLYWLGWRPIWVAESKENAAQDGESNTAASDASSQSLTLTYARGTLDADRLIIDSTAYYNAQTKMFDATGGRRHSIKYIHGSAGMSLPQLNAQRSRGSGTSPTSNSDIRNCLMNRPLGFDFGDVGIDPATRHAAMDRLALSCEAARLVEELRQWRSAELWHHQRQLPWRRGVLLYGPPGTGKTALARAIAEDLDLPIHVFDLPSLRNDELQRSWNQMLEEMPCMALMEDIDAVFHGRKNIAVSSGPALTFDCLLNCLDGVQRTDGLVTVMTTNHIELVDAAIAKPAAAATSESLISGDSDAAIDEIGSRPGRIDRIVRMGDFDDAGRKKIATRILPESTRYAELLCKLGRHDTPAQFQERCARVALAMHYNDQEVLSALEKRDDPS